MTSRARVKGAVCASALILFAGCAGLKGLPTLADPPSAATTASPQATATASAIAAAGTPAPTASDTWWVPKGGASFQVQYSGKIDLSLPVDVYDLDWDATSIEQVNALKAKGIAPVCYFNAGASEDWRADRSKFPDAVVGKPLDGWVQENWLDVRAIDVLIPLMTARMDICRRKGFVAVDPDNTDGYTQNSGFDISAADQIAYQKALAEAAHRMGLGIGLKNDQDQLSSLGSVVDFAVNEECVRYKECPKYQAFIDSGKAVFNIEYTGDIATICATRPKGMSSILKDSQLTAARAAC